MSTKKRLIDWLCKMNSEGEEYYLLHYTNSNSLSKYLNELKLCKNLKTDFIKAYQKFENSYKELEEAKYNIMKEYDISDEDIEM